ncbi:hypothetical protein E6O75_ATG00972 [Venturia nashicola]|uniref:Rhodopsin domain-containing protein n=1 Tax=Venturia nashicola TaxID=86259 RepID=A0A4Z1PU25_9PEZI|nr:hypothetical protein E6O75_ATG00972 [Venturia nashicola]
MTSSPGASSTTLPGLAPITDTNKAGILWIASLLSGIYAILAILVRWYQKRKCFGIDDWICLAATIVGMGSFVAIYIALSQGLGKSTDLLSAAALQDIGKTVFASRIALIAALCLSKCSVTCLIKRLFSQDMQTHRMLCDFVLAAIAFWGLSSIIGITIVCQPSELLDHRYASCGGQTLRWQLIGAFDSLTEVMIVILTLGLIWRLQMRLELKIKVVLAFVFRLPLLAIISIHSRYITHAPQHNLSMTFIWLLTIEQVQLGYSLISATIPNLKSFLMMFDTAVMMDISHKLSSIDRSATTAQEGFGSIGTRPPRLSDDYHGFHIGSLRPERCEHVAAIHHTETRSTSTRKDDSSASRDFTDEGNRTIRRDMQWMVEEAFAGSSRS